MNNKPTVSVVIPCFNGSKYIEKCFFSLRNQTYKNFEVIFIDDCSSDGSYEKLLNLEGGPTIEIKVFRNIENRGPGYSRKLGIENSIGEYICFCDIDDWYEFNFIESMLYTLDIEKSDCVFCDYYYVFKNGKKKDTNWYNNIENSNDQRKLLIYAQDSLCITMTKRTILNNIEFPHLFHGEDAAIIPLIITKSKKCSICKKGLYNYLMRENSASNKFDRKAFDSSFEVYKHILNNIDTNLFKDESEFLGIRDILYTGCLNAIKCNISASEIYRAIKMFNSPNKNPYMKDLKRSKRIFIYLITHKLMLFAKFFSILHTKYINK